MPRLIQEPTYADRISLKTHIIFRNDLQLIPPVRLGHNGDIDIEIDLSSALDLPACEVKL